ncbi:MAG TPA: SMP-30/gluconolactonase/LRE family protein [Blastocatellia bacterium]|nr:SMP-30/gluconolactonase/LRE family protein [Blastocatellia bacterium]
MRKVVAFWLAPVLALAWIFLPGIDKPSVVQAQGEGPQIKRLRPDIITAGTRTFTIRLEGRGFDSAANVLFDGVPLAKPRTSNKGKVLLAEVNASQVAAPGTHTVRGVNPDGTMTPVETLTVQAQDPDLVIRLDGNAAEEGSGLIFLPTILTDSFSNGSDFLVWGRGGTAKTDVNGGFQIEIPADLVKDPAEIPITLISKNGSISNTEIFFIVPRPVKITSVDPDTLEVGTDDVELNVSGDFKPGATLFVNDMLLDTTVGKNGQLKATLPGILRSRPTRLVVRVEQDGIQSKDQIIPVTPTDLPFIFTVAPIRIRTGEKKLSIEVVGANFDKKVKALVDGKDTVIRSFTRTSLIVAIDPDLPLGRHTVQVVDSDGNTTSTAAFEVVADVTVSTFSGSGFPGLDTGCVSGDEARFSRPRRMSFGPDGLLYVTDQQNHAIRTLDSSGQVCLFAGTGEEGYNDSGNTLGKAPTFSFPNGVAVDPGGTVYVTENGNSVVRRIRRSGSSINVDTFAGTFNEITEKSRQTKLNSTRQGLVSYRDGGALDSAFRLPDEIVIAPDGAIYVADAGNHAIRRIRQNGGQLIVETVAGNGVPGFADGAAANARFNTPTGLVISADGSTLFVADTNNNRIRKINLSTGRVSTLAGGGDGGIVDGPGGDAILSRPIGLALDSDGVLYAAELGLNDIRRIDPASNVTTLAGGGAVKLRDGAGIDARFAQPRGLAIDRARGILYVADYENFVIRKISLR